MENSEGLAVLLERELGGIEMTTGVFSVHLISKVLKHQTLQLLIKYPLDPL